jgi:hypothetical protein
MTNTPVRGLGRAPGSTRRIEDFIWKAGGTNSLVTHTGEHEGTY